jgi:hypothetical protein
MGVQSAGVAILIRADSCYLWFMMKSAGSLPMLKARSMSIVLDAALSYLTAIRNLKVRPQQIICQQRHLSIILDRKPA